MTIVIVVATNDRGDDNDDNDKGDDNNDYDGGTDNHDNDGLFDMRKEVIIEIFIDLIFCLINFLNIL